MSLEATCLEEETRRLQPITIRSSPRQVRRILIVEDRPCDFRPYIPTGSRADLEVHLACYDLFGKPAELVEQQVRQRLGCFSKNFPEVLAVNFTTLIDYMSTHKYDYLVLDGLKGDWQKVVSALPDPRPKIVITSCDKDARDTARQLGYAVMTKGDTRHYAFR